jgi:predicted peptidase
MAILEETCQSHPIDADRVSVAGISSGGTAAWEIAIRHPDRFSAIAPISSAGAHEASVKRIVNMPVWAFQSQRDPYAPISAVQQTIQALHEAGGAAELTAVSLSPTSKLWVHDAWTEAFKEYGLLEWLLAQRRGEKALNPRWHVVQRHYINWDYLWPRLIPVAMLALGVAAWRYEKRRSQAAR